MTTDSQNAPSGPPIYLKVPSIDDCSATVVLLHGLGDTPEGFLRLARQLRSKPGLSHVQFILPAAPARMLTATMLSTPAWFDIYSFDYPLTIPEPGEEDEAGISQSIASLDALLAGLVAGGVDPSRLVLGGFSQGAAMTLLTGLTTGTPLAGLFVLSGRLPLRRKIKSMVSPQASSIPIFWGHGTADSLVTHDLGRVSADFVMSELGVPPAPPVSLSTHILGWLGYDHPARTEQPQTPTGLAFHSYSGLRHEIGAEELGDLASWLKAILPPLNAAA